jgi:PHD/YefM family antitoxin component YafN of YafNO toxin-antitoxin module
MTTTTTLDISEARKQFTKLDERLKEDRLIWITRHNKQVFAVVHIELMQACLETLEILEDPEAIQMLRQSLEDIRAGRLHDHEDVKQEVLHEEARNYPVDGHGQGRSKKTSAQSAHRDHRKGR